MRASVSVGTLATAVKACLFIATASAPVMASTILARINDSGAVIWTGKLDADDGSVPAGGTGCFVVSPGDARLLAFQASQNVAPPGAMVVVSSASNSALNGTYSTDDAAKANIIGIYTGIKNAGHLPGGGTTF